MPADSQTAQPKTVLHWGLIEVETEAHLRSFASDEVANWHGRRDIK